MKIMIKCLMVFGIVILNTYLLFLYFISNAWSGVPLLGYGSIMVAFVLAELVFVFRKKKKIAIVLLCSSLLLTSVGVLRKMVFRYDQNIPQVKDDDAVIFNRYQPFSKGSAENSGIHIDSNLKLTEDLPRLDGATALYPIYASIVQNVYPQGEYPYYLYDSNDEKDSLVVCSKTPTAYERLIQGKTDIIFVAAPSQKQLEAAKNANVEFEMTPIGKESFVFFVNAKNPVKELTMEQIQSIYSGKVTNWQEVGGKDEKIKAFQRPEGSGSQSALQRLMGELPIIDPLENVINGMGEIIHETANYKNYKNAIGYSFRYYSTELVKENEIKHLAINGVYPTRENILNGTYPITNEFYAITLKGHTNPNIDRLIDWIVQSQGQQIIDEVGYVSLYS